MPLVHDAFLMGISSPTYALVFDLSGLNIVSFESSNLGSYKRTYGYRTFLDHCAGFVPPCRCGVEFLDEYAYAQFQAHHIVHLKDEYDLFS